MTTPKTFIERAEEEFDEVNKAGFSSPLDGREMTRLGDWQVAMVKSLLSSKLSEAVREMAGAVPEVKQIDEEDKWFDGYNQARQALITKAREMGVEVE